MLPALLVLLGLGVTPPEARPAGETGSRPRAEGEAQPDENMRRYLGTWRRQDRISGPQGEVDVEGYVLIRWRRDQLRVKTLDYFPATGTRVRESDWKGEIRVDAWNFSRQTFVPMPDGTLSVGLSGSNNSGPDGASYWWASGRMWVEAEGTRLRLVTTDGYAGSRVGNLWQPIDFTFEKVSEEIDPRFDPRP